MLFELAEVETGDGVFLQGLISVPKEKKLAVIYVHGLGGDFYGSPRKVRAIAEECLRKGFGFFTFNNRGSGTIGGVKRADRKNPKGYGYVKSGRCYERFEECILDIGAFVKEAKRRGYRKIVLVGHSTGANKVVYYLSRKPDRSVIRAVLTGPVSDVPSQEMQSGKKYKKLVSLARKMVSGRKGDELMPRKAPGWPISAQRFLSLSVPGSAEDIFQYHMKNPKYRAIRKIRIPVLAVLGGEDEWATMKPGFILESYRQANQMIESAIIEDALHSFNGREELLAKVVCGWLSETR
jgi:pimeloyl-ACP methyl ester carboxylesterase